MKLNINLSEKDLEEIGKISTKKRQWTYASWWAAGSLATSVFHLSFAHAVTALGAFLAFIVIYVYYARKQSNWVKDKIDNSN